MFFAGEARLGSGGERESPAGDGKGLNIQTTSGIAVSGRLALRDYTGRCVDDVPVARNHS
jgi:hypothetical protein